MAIIGNVSILTKHIEDQGIDVIVDKKTIGDSVNIEDYDFIYIGAGTERSLNAVLKDFKKYKEKVQDFINDNKVFLCTGNSFEMFGKKIDGEDALGIFDFETKTKKLRDTCDVIYSSKFLKEKIIGFVNKQSNIYHNNNPLFNVEYGVGENENNDYEGVKYKNFYGTHVIGPLLVKNPAMLKSIYRILCKNKNKDYKFKEPDDKNEQEGYKITLYELEKRKTQKD